jgi:hypothetical protein
VLARFAPGGESSDEHMEGVVLGEALAAHGAAPRLDQTCVTGWFSMQGAMCAGALRTWRGVV